MMSNEYKKFTLVDDASLNYKGYLQHYGGHHPILALGELVSAGEYPHEAFKHHLKQCRIIQKEIAWQDTRSVKYLARLENMICFRPMVKPSAKEPQPAPGTLGYLMGVYKMEIADQAPDNRIRHEYGLVLRNVWGDDFHFPLKLVVTSHTNKVFSVQYYVPNSQGYLQAIVTFAGNCSRNKYWDLWYNGLTRHLSVLSTLAEPPLIEGYNNIEPTMKRNRRIIAHCEDAMSFINAVADMRYSLGTALDDFPDTAGIFHTCGECNSSIWY